MKIAVTYENGKVFQHFGHTAQFKVYEVEGNKIVSSKVVDTNGQGHGALAGLLKIIGADILICGGIGGGAQTALANAGIKLYGGVSGSCDAAVEALLMNSLGYNPNVRCDHHDHEHGNGEHNCGEHSCGTHNCSSHSCHK
ncbi:MAG: dinitrogenase iron-molybdenum cofactor biosynthesis protein [Oscillospiraceae bacterium]|nr:dinitrogenase iron-molybdenum cofactor biosynthesis protein [Oscillospiraceae bacterium]MBP1552537.1 dinitrogenase iron-molybdenum cofactor biosynthesis protein [Oscillospiraceae bacterium]MBP1571785.1 dinitrogenase iron-molybdenum cofactor biosynthesis protein [Oscillospiraceae bacterium]MBQ5312692.1 dinitrogenase iron-molybdenum cofactor biosynthesis protein [Oscillospiraceae bacterium]MBQ5324185.1 dinitrogenase iron-molybdenum cofactor biosynthesis protein [Oscillospiraceae bacterium]